MDLIVPLGNVYYYLLVWVLSSFSTAHYYISPFTQYAISVETCWDDTVLLLTLTPHGVCQEQFNRIANWWCPNPTNHFTFKKYGIIGMWSLPQLFSCAYLFIFYRFIVKVKSHILILHLGLESITVFIHWDDEIVQIWQWFLQNWFFLGVSVIVKSRSVYQTFLLLLELFLLDGFSK